MQAPSNTHETIVGCLDEVEKARPDSPQCSVALQTLATLTKFNSQNRTQVAQTPGAVSTLLALCSSSSSSGHLALSILFHLSLNPELKLTLADPDAISRLNSLVLSPRSCKLAASLLCSLAMLDKNKARFGIAGTVDALVRALGDPAVRFQAVNHLLSALTELVQFHGNSTLAVRAGAVPVLFGMIRDPVAAAEDLAGPSFTLLSLLARYKEGMWAIREVEGVVGLLVGGMRGCMTSRESAVEILVRLLEESEECMREAAGEQLDLLNLLADVSIRGSGKAREKAGLLTRMMMEAANLHCYVDASHIVVSD